MKRCISCIIPETFPGIKFNSDGVCSLCIKFEEQKGHIPSLEKLRTKFDEIINQNKSKNSKYDALVAYSGGKDSTFLIHTLKVKYGLNMLALTFDNGFLSEQAIRNTQTVMENLGIDHVLLKPRLDVLKKIFNECTKKNIYSPKTIERASTVCTSCMGIVKFSALRMALEKNIPFIAFGWSPGQAPITSSIMKNNPQMVKMMQKAIFEPLYGLVGDKIKPSAFY